MQSRVLYVRSSLSPVPSVMVSAVPKRVMSFDTRRPPSSRHRWSSYELMEKAALSLAAHQAAEDYEIPEHAAAPVENPTILSQSCSTATVSTRPVPDQHCPQDAPHEIVPDLSVTEDSTAKERHRSQDDEILGNVFVTIFRTVVCFNLFIWWP